jgi:hypothetical protein
MRPAQHAIIVHSPRRFFWRPWQVVCRCGLGAYPCYAVTMLQRQAAMQPREGTRARVGRSPVMPPRRSPLLTPGQAARSRLGRQQ